MCAGRSPSGDRSSNRCIHDRVKYCCRICKGSSICYHGNLKYNCRDCGTFKACLHGTPPHRCKKCGGSSVCEHKKLKYYCRQCKGTGICIHDIRKSRCRLCKRKSKHSSKKRTLPSPCNMQTDDRNLKSLPEVVVEIEWPLQDLSSDLPIIHNGEEN